MEEKKVYLSGPITGREISEVITEFSKAEQTAIEKGFKVFNPLFLAEKIGYHREWIDYI